MNLKQPKSIDQREGESIMIANGNSPQVLRLRRARLAALCVASALACAPAVLTAGVPETANATVTLAGLDLTTAEGLRQADERLARAARRLCRRFYESNHSDNSQTQADCYHEAYAGARAHLQSRLVSIAAEREKLAQNAP
jgi:UrcA family protein